MKPNDLPASIARELGERGSLTGLGTGSLREPMQVSLEPTARRDALGTFTSHTFANTKGARDYKLYVPSSDSGRPMPLLVMLHGCQQEPDDFAAGTRMNALADRHGFLVAYPSQTFRSNGANCWNWYEPSEQKRSGQEPSLIAGMVKAIGLQHAIAPGRVFVAGFSAGAAMAVILGQTYPKLFAGVAAHSGMPRGAAHDVGSAFAAMHGRASAQGRQPFARSGKPVRTLVLHGDADRTVQADNGGAITQQVVRAFRQAKRPLVARVGAGNDVGVDTRVVTDYVDPAGRVMVREWIEQGGSHAWFGGCPEGSFTQLTGPDASAEVVHFFLQDSGLA